jgi:hypothetical protein
VPFRYTRPTILQVFEFGDHAFVDRRGGGIKPVDGLADHFAAGLVRAGALLDGVFVQVERAGVGVEDFAYFGDKVVQELH